MVSCVVQEILRLKPFLGDGTYEYDDKNSERPFIQASEFIAHGFFDTGNFFSDRRELIIYPAESGVHILKLGVHLVRLRPVCDSRILFNEFEVLSRHTLCVSLNTEISCGLGESKRTADY